MAFSEEEKEFLHHLSASIIVPADPSHPINELLEEGTDIVQRSHLFFDERLKVYLVLDIPVCSEEDLKSCLSRLDLKVETWAIASSDLKQTQPNSNDPTRELIVSERITESEDPVTIVKQNEDEADVSLQLVWEVYLTLSRPRLRLLEPSVELVPNVVIAPKEDLRTEQEYLEPYTTFEPNLLEPLGGIPGDENQPYLPISRLQKVLPTPPKKDIRIRLAYTASDLTKIYPAVIARLRYTKVNTHTPFPATIASLDIEMIPLVEIDGSIEKAEISMKDGQVTPLTDSFLPMACKSKDCITFLFDLQPLQQGSGSLSNSLSLTRNPPVIGNIVVLSISVLLSIKVSETYNAAIKMDWTTNVDFSQALNPSFGPASQPIQRTKRPGSLPFGSIDPRTAPQSSISSLQSVPSRALAAPPTTDVLTISFVAPNHPVKVGSPFSWRVLIVNRSAKPVRLAIIPLARVQRAPPSAQPHSRRHAPKTSISSVQTADRQAKAKRYADLDIARAVLDENVLYALQHSSAVQPDTDLVSLTAELRVGPLGIGQCHESEIRFVAFKPGAYMVDAIRVVDVVKEAEDGVGAPGVINDIRELPDIIVEEDNELAEGMDRLKLGLDTKEEAESV